MLLTVNRFPTSSSEALLPLTHSHVVLAVAPCQPARRSKSTFTPQSISPV